MQKMPSQPWLTDKATMLLTCGAAVVCSARVRKISC